MTDAFRHRTTIQVRFRDTDAFGHVNNAVFFSYVELARVLEVLHAPTASVRWFDGRPVLDRQSLTMPLVDLRRWLGKARHAGLDDESIEALFQTTFRSEMRKVA